VTGEVVSGIPAGVGRTALGVAMVRAAESRRRDRLFDDPYAAAFVAAAPAVFNRENRGAAAFAGGVSAKAASFWTQAVIRTRFFDDYLLYACSAGVRQAVLVASGLDTRAYRLAWPDGVRLFEVDQPDVLTFKRKVLRRRGAAARCEHRAVPADLREDWGSALAEAGLRTGVPTAWLLEGLLIYLTADEAKHVLSTVHDLSAVDSVAAFEAGDFPVGAARDLPSIAEYAGLWKGGLTDPSGWLAASGWRITEHPAAEVAARYGRTLDAGGFATAAKG
jgi:methyltransferase (TIGR00027 family)